MKKRQSIKNNEEKKKEPIQTPRNNRAVRFVSLYVVWLFVGTMFYAYAPQSNLGLVMGLYMAINIGYSIGFGFPAEPYNPYLLFSSCYVIVGASFVAMALSFFADKISEDHDNWFTNLMQKRNYDEAMKKGKPLKKKIKAVFIQYSAPIRAVSLWVVLILSMTLYSRVQIKEWDWKQAQYFAISTCSTGGHYGIPPDSPTWLFGLTAIMMMIGVPVMAVAMASMATVFTDQGDLESTKDLICEEVNIKELVMLQKFGLENGDGVIDRAEFIILCMVRIGTEPSLIEFISDRFAELDDDGGGTLSIKEITRGKYDCIDGKIVPVDKDKVKPKSKRNIMQSTRKMLSLRKLNVDDDSSDEEIGIAWPDPAAQNKGTERGDGSPKDALSGQDRTKSLQNINSAANPFPAPKARPSLSRPTLNAAPSDLSDNSSNEDDECKVPLVSSSPSHNNNDSNDCTPSNGSLKKIMAFSRGAPPRRPPPPGSFPSIDHSYSDAAIPSNNGSPRERFDDENQQPYSDNNGKG